MTTRRAALMIGAAVLATVTGIAAWQRTASAQAGVTYGDVEAYAALGKGAANAKGPISRVEFSRGYPGAPGMADDKYVVLVTTGSTRACAIMGDGKDEMLAVYDLLASKKVRSVRCVTGTDAYGRVRLDAPNGVVLSSY